MLIKIMTHQRASPGINSVAYDNTKGLARHENKLDGFGDLFPALARATQHSSKT